MKPDDRNAARPTAERPPRVLLIAGSNRRGAPMALGVIVATGYGYRRTDGIAVIPIGALGP